MSTFDPNIFEQQQVESRFNTEWTPVPPGEYIAFIQDMDYRTFQNDDGSEAVYMTVIFRIDDEELAQKLGVEEPRVRASFRLDLAEDGVTLLSGPNKNVRLGKLRDALGQNEPGWSPAMLKGAGPIKIAVENTERDGVVYSNVTAFTKA